MRIHLIAIGGSAMHNMALALHEKGYHVTGSDDEIREPSRSRLAAKGLLPAYEGWNPEIITPGLDAVILGMHARADNPELIRAQELGLTIFSYPEYLYEQSRDKTRIVIGGSHGKTSITAMVLHVFKHCGIDTDFMVGAQLAGFDTMVRITRDAKYIVLEGDEYLASPVDRRPKFHLYHPHIALLSGIAWDHINVFPTFDNYVEQFRIFINKIESGGTLIYCGNDEVLKETAETTAGHHLTKQAYTVPPHEIANGTTTLLREDGRRVPLLVFGDHNLMNLEGARMICEKAGISTTQFDEAIQSFKGAARRLELVRKSDTFNCYKDFAHSPSKLKATTAAVRKQFPQRTLVACMELHTFSSLTAEFLAEYNGAMNTADVAYVYFNPHTIAHKKLPPITEAQVRQAFARDDIKVSTDSAALVAELKQRDWNNSVLLLMTSGNFDGVNFDELAAVVDPKQ
ncbi:MAG: Mur ligase family protein [Bacteroidia bacterium]|jgi:UDP-N-acetylmuramate: L-alanyl-gamma-D-glutamyl-meso-diaminopimelate ligase|nr:Mur ligase family protein [Bacteroidia bacterium]